MKNNADPKKKNTTSVPEIIKKRTHSRKTTIFKYFKQLGSSHLLWIILALAVLSGALLIGYLYPEKTSAQISVNDPSLIGHINRLSNDFVADGSSFFEGWTLKDVKNTLGHVYWSTQAPFLTGCFSHLSKDDVPKTFSVMEQWPQCFKNHRLMHEVQRCSASWALATASALSDRFCIVDNTMEGTRLSPQELLSCDLNNQGCTSGSIDRASTYIRVQGLVSEECFPYTGNTNDTPCALKCNAQLPMKASGVCRVTGEEAIMMEVMTNGPITALLVLYDDFLVYKGGIYTPLKTAKRLTDSDKNALLHAVKIMGWGGSKGKEYWLIENSFGPTWGEGGFARIKRSALSPVTQYGNAAETNLLSDGVTIALIPDVEYNEQVFRGAVGSNAGASHAGAAEAHHNARNSDEPEDVDVDVEGVEATRN